jgi:hypothetical protein
MRVFEVSLVRRKASVAIVSMLFTLTGCELPTPETEADKKLKPQLLGRWYREGKLRDDEGIEHILLEIKSSDRFEVNFRELRKGDIPSSGAQFGQWYLVDGFFKLKTEVRNGVALDRKDMVGYRTYKFVSVLESEFVLEDPLNREMLKFRRVPSGFKLP